MIILTGSDGFIGSHFKDKLDKKNDLVCVEIDNARSFLNDFNQWEDVSTIYHQGAISNTREKNIQKLYEFNIDFSIQLFEKAIKYSIPIKYASSASVYGNTKNEINPLNNYSISKTLIDYWVLDNIDKFKHIQGFRYFNVYGKGEDDKIKNNQASPISTFINQVKKNGTLKLFKGSEDFYRDFIYVEDVASAIMASLGFAVGKLAKSPKGKLYEVGGPDIFSFRQLMEMTLMHIQRRRLLVPVPYFALSCGASIAALLPNPPITLDQVQLLKCDNIVSQGARTLSDLGVTPTCVDAVLPTYLDRYRPGGLFAAS